MIKEDIKSDSIEVTLLSADPESAKMWYKSLWIKIGYKSWWNKIG